MAGKGFCVKIRLELHAITCPGEWLCPNGKVALRITSLGSTLESNRVSPIFPLLYHNEFNFKKTFTRLAALTELQRKLEQEFLYAELIQWVSPCNDNAVILATFETNLADLLYPVVNYKGLLAGIDVDLLMEPTRYFPGIIAPKIEISTRTVIEEVLGVCCSSLDGAYVVNPKTIDSKRTCAHRKRPVKGIIRQRKVCHSRAKAARVPACRPTRCESSNLENSYQGEQPRINECYHPTRRRLNDRCEVGAGKRNHRLSTVCGNLHIFESCPVCSKYKCYFSCKDDDIVHQCKQNSLKDVRDSQSFPVCDDRCCCTCAKDDDLLSRESYIALHSKGPHLSGSKEKDCKAKSISECNALYLQQPDETKHGFYKNLERFYKRMHKQARRRAQEANVF
ncbi:uncharacterized protein LOC117607318 isoform X1 [Osmia lignaria lignaria]|uniref:uncharacterized protein LOC117607318 isoform X1 n=1 Tax=Osmia lignaria lignaria TaxID=1437193 RepID=UPI0014790AA4|nr:spermatogenesis-associated protein 6 [Osmia lignaria]